MRLKVTGITTFRHYLHGVFNTSRAKFHLATPFLLFPSHLCMNYISPSASSQYYRI